MGIFISLIELYVIILRQRNPLVGEFPLSVRCHQLKLRHVKGKLIPIFIFSHAGENYLFINTVHVLCYLGFEIIIEHLKPDEQLHGVQSQNFEQHHLGCRVWISLASFP